MRGGHGDVIARSNFGRSICRNRPASEIGCGMIVFAREAWANEFGQLGGEDKAIGCRLGLSWILRGVAAIAGRRGVSLFGRERTVLVFAKTSRRRDDLVVERRLFHERQKHHAPAITVAVLAWGPVRVP